MVAAIMDCNFRRIPNACIVAGGVIGLIMQIVGHGVWGIVSWMIACVTVFVLGLPLYLLHQLGAGDCKLCMITAGLMGLHKGAVCLCISFLLAGVGAVMTMAVLFVRKVRETGFALCVQNLYYQKRLFLEKGWRKRTLPMAVPVFLAYLICTYVNLYICVKQHS